MIIWKLLQLKIFSGDINIYRYGDRSLTRPYLSVFSVQLAIHSITLKDSLI